MESENKNIPKYSVHKVLAHSYTMYFVLFLVGVALDLVFGFKIFRSSVMVPGGFFFLVLATVIILWAQKAGRDLGKVKEVKSEHFCRGPYCYTRSPTHWGLFLMMLGFGIMANAVFVILSTLFSFIIAKFVFLGKEEAILEEKYGAPYLEYKKLVKY
jgi:protein-S-isoprenylcysteine O-methyltransferase Ste14